MSRRYSKKKTGTGRGAPQAPRRVGLVGLGIMGSAFGANLLRAGFEVLGTDIDPRRRAELKRLGGRPVGSAAEVARRSDIVVTSLPSPKALAAVAEDIARGRRGASLVVETSTLALADKEAARARLARAGVTLLDCTVSGTGAQARSKDLLVYASGPREAYVRAKAVFGGFARAHHYVGAFGAGTKMKFVANLLVAIHNVAAGEAFALALKAGLDPALVYRVVGDGAGGSRMFTVRGPMMVAGDYASDVTMKVDVWQKDMHLIADFATGLGCPTPLFAASAPVYTAAMAAGHAPHDTASVCDVLCEAAGVERRARRRKAARRRR